MTKALVSNRNPIAAIPKAAAAFARLPADSRSALFQALQDLKRAARNEGGPTPFGAYCNGLADTVGFIAQIVAIEPDVPPMTRIDQCTLTAFMDKHGEPGRRYYALLGGGVGVTIDGDNLALDGQPPRPIASHLFARKRVVAYRELAPADDAGKVAA